MAAVTDGLNREHPNTNAGRGAMLEGMRPAVIGGDLRRTSMLPRVGVVDRLESAARHHAVRRAAARPLTFASVIVLLAVTAAASRAGPAWRATRIDPVVTLRNE
ncbi:MAG: hypothetical protein ABGY72_20585 [bacterium]